MDKPLLQSKWMVLILFISTIYSCADPVEFPPETGYPYERLSEYSFFRQPLKDLMPEVNVFGYELNTPLFSDYAEKSRFLYIPQGHSIQYHKDEVLDFPAGVILIKNFFYEQKGERHLLETRLLIRTREGWKGFPYVWDEGQTDAHLKRGGAFIETLNPFDPDKSFQYIVPNQNQCKGCHSLNNIMTPIGPKAGNLNRQVLIDDAEINQLDYWISMGMLKGLSSSINAQMYPQWDDPETGSLDERARVYLDVNCGHCHQPEGPANNSRLFLNILENNPYNLGFCKTPIAPGGGTGGRHYDIVPGEPDQSILLFRMESTEPDIRMPELGRTLPHTEGIKLIRDWIISLEHQSCNELSAKSNI